jgi:acyl-CoA synthetase (AMP-forming)/AMP-acid ligase II
MDPTSLLAEAARRRPSGAAVRCGPLELTYPGLVALAGGLAHDLEARGARAGDRVGVLLPNCHLYLALYFAALQAGLVLVPLNLRLSARELRAILSHAGARLIAGPRDRVRALLEGDDTPRGAGAPGDAPDLLLAPLAGVPGCAEGGTADLPPPPDAAHLYYTSGTTGTPKGVILTRANLAAHVLMTLGELGFREEDAWLHAAPMFHLADAWAVWTATAAAATHVLLPRFAPADAFDLMEGAGVTLTNLVPTMLIALLEEAERLGRPLSRLRLLLSGGAPIAPSVVARIERAFGCEYVQTYGLTETSPFLTFAFGRDQPAGIGAAERAARLARAGRAARGVALRVVTHPSGDPPRDVAADDAAVGEVIARGPTVTPGYWRDPEGTAAAFRDGWFHTGDLATIDAGGSINLVDRAKDVIITGGETVYSVEVEKVLYAHPAVREAAVFGIPDARWGEAVRAAVVLREPGGAAAADLTAFCRARIARYKCPAVIDLVEALPRTGSGKIDKKELRAPFWKGETRQIH